MEEIIKIKSINSKCSVFKIIAILCLITAVIFSIWYSVQYQSAREEIDTYWRGYEANESLYESGSEFAVSPRKFKEQMADVYNAAHKEMDKAQMMLPIAVISALLCIVCAFIWLFKGKVKLTVTDKRVYGNAVFGKQVDLPLSSIVLIEIGKKDTLTLATAAGKVRFAGIKNRDEVYSEIQSLIATN